MPIDSNLFCARVGVYNFNMQSYKKELNIHIKPLSTTSLKKSFKLSLFMLIVFYLLVVFLNSSFIFIFKGASESITKTNLTLHDYMLTIRYFKHLLLLLSGDTKINPGPKRSSNIRFCHWNLNGLVAHDFIKVTLVEAFITSNKFDLVCLSETFSDSTIPDDDANIQINGYSLLTADHPNDIKRGGVCIYFEESLPLIRRNDLTNIKDCFVTEINVNNKKCFFTCLCRSPSQSHDELERFCTNFDLLLSNINNLHPTCSVVLGDFNAKCSKWCAPDKNNTSGIELDNITTTSGYNQMIDKPTHFINESSSRIDLIFSSNVNLTKNCGIEQSPYKTCHHNIIYRTLNFNIPLPSLF